MFGGASDVPLIERLDATERVLWGGHPEGWMLGILMGNVFAPLFDWFVVQANVKRRALRYG